MEAKFKVRQDLAYWACDAGQFEPGEEHIATGSEVEAVIAAAAAGSLVDLVLDDEAAALDVVESNTASEVKLEEAMENGEWLKGHLAQAELDKEASVVEVGEG